MNKMNWKWTLVFAAALVGATVLLDAEAWAGKPTKPADPPPPPPIHYQINYFTAPGGGSFANIWAMNNSGVMVGNYVTSAKVGSAFIYDPRGLIYDPGDTPDQAIDLNDLVQVPVDEYETNGWRISNAFSVNDWGAILVTIVKNDHPYSSDIYGTIDPDFQARGLLIDTRDAPDEAGKWPATPILVPESLDPVPTFCYGHHINNNGDVLGVFRGPFVDTTQTAGAFLYNTEHYDEIASGAEPAVLQFVSGNSPAAQIANVHAIQLNNPHDGELLQIAGQLGDSTRTVFRYTPEFLHLDKFPELSADAIRAINGPGEFCGRISVPTQKNVSRYVLRPFSFNPDSLPSPTLTLIGTESEESGKVAAGINGSGDLVLDGSGDLFHDGILLRLVDLVMGNLEDVAYFRSVRWGGNARLTERRAIGTKSFPCISVWTGGIGCFLVPVE